MKKLLSLLFIGAALQILFGCTNLHDEIETARGLSAGGIAGTMQTPKAWDENAVKWTSSDVDKGIYEYEFTASDSAIEWKVLIKRGVWDPAYAVEGIALNGNQVKLKEVRGLDKITTEGLESGGKYKIVVIQKGDQVYAKVVTK